MKICLLTTAATHHIYYANRLNFVFPGMSFKVIIEQPIDFSSLGQARQKVSRLLKERDAGGLIQYFPYFKINPFSKREAEFASSLLPDAKYFRAPTWKFEHHYQAISVIREFNPDLMIVFGARRLHREFLTQWSCPIVNHHGAVLPYFRGLDADPWLCFYKRFDYLGCSIHMVTEKLDQGRVLIKRKLALPREAHLWQLRALKVQLHVQLMIDLLINWPRSLIGAIPNNIEEGFYRSWAPWWVYWVADRNLKKFTR